MDKMNSSKMNKELQKRLAHPDRQFQFDQKQDQLRIENKHTGKGMTISLPGVVGKWQEQKEKAIDEIVYYVEEGLGALDADPELLGKEKNLSCYSIHLFSIRNEGADSVYL